MYIWNLAPTFSACKERLIWERSYLRYAHESTRFCEVESQISGSHIECTYSSYIRTVNRVNNKKRCTFERSYLRYAQDVRCCVSTRFCEVEPQLVGSSIESKKSKEDSRIEKIIKNDMHLESTASLSACKERLIWQLSYLRYAQDVNCCESTRSCEAKLKI